MVDTPKARHQGWAGKHAKGRQKRDHDDENNEGRLALDCMFCMGQQELWIIVAIMMEGSDQLLFFTSDGGEVMLQ